MVIFHFYPHVQTNPLFGGSLPSGLLIPHPKMENLDSNDSAPQKDAEHVFVQLVQEYVPHNSQVSNLSMAGGCYVPMSQVSAPKNGWLSRFSPRPAMSIPGLSKTIEKRTSEKNTVCPSPLNMNMSTCSSDITSNMSLKSGHVTVIQSFLLNIPQATLPSPPAPRNAREKPWT